MMRMRVHRWLLGLALVLVAGAPAFAQSDPGGIAIDVFETQAVSSGQNGGEIGQFQNMTFHHWMNHPNLSNTSVVVTQQRIKDAEGVALNDERRAPNYVSQLFPTVHKPGLPDGPGCDDHQWKGWHFGGTGSGVFDWEASLSARGAEPGYYRVTFEWHGLQKQYERGYLVQRMQPYVFQFKDQYGQPFGGLSFNQLEPYPAPIGTSDANSGYISTQLAPGPYEFQITGPQTDGRYYELYVQPVDDTPELLQVVITVQRQAGIPAATTGQFALKVTGKDTGAPVQANLVYSVGQFQTTAGGEYESGHIERGKYGVQLTASGYHPGTVEVEVVAGILRTYQVKLIPLSDPQGPPEVVEPTEHTNTTWLQSLFVPSEETLDKWQDLINQVKGWGPFGVASSFFTTWGGAARSGVNVPRFAWTMNLWGPGQGAVEVVVDLRETLPEGQTYSDGTAGTWGGDLRKWGRSILGMVFWVGFLFAIVTWLRPRLNW